MTAPENDNSPFAPTESDADAVFDFSGPDWSDPFSEWLNLPGDCPTDSIRLDALEMAISEDPFATTHLDDCLVGLGVGPTPFDRYRRANRRYLRSFHDDDDTAETTEIYRLIALHWLTRARSILLD